MITPEEVRAWLQITTDYPPRPFDLEAARVCLAALALAEEMRRTRACPPNCDAPLCELTRAYETALHNGHP